MPRKGLDKTPAEQQAMRETILQWMAAHGLADERAFAGFLELEYEGVHRNLDTEPRYRDRRPLARPFVERVRAKTGLPLLVDPAPEPAPPPEPPPESLIDHLTAFLAQVDLATAEQLARLTGRTVGGFNKLGAELRDRSVLASVPEPLRSGAAGPRHLWGLGRLGARRAAALLGRKVRRIIERDALRGDLAVGHTLAVTDIAVALQLALAPPELVFWAADAACRAALALPGRSFAEPDLFFVYERPQHQLHACWVEFETGTQGEANTAEKVSAVDDYQQRGLRVDHGTERLRLLWVAPTLGHARRLRERVGPLRPRVQSWFAALGDIREYGLTGSYWLTVNGRETRHALLDS